MFHQSAVLPKATGIFLLQSIPVEDTIYLRNVFSETGPWSEEICHSVQFGAIWWVQNYYKRNTNTPENDTRYNGQLENVRHV